MEDHYVVIPSNTDLNRGDQALVWESVRLSKEAGLLGKYYLFTSGETAEETIKQSQQTRQFGYDFLAPVLRHPSRRRAGEGHGQFYAKQQIVGWGIQALADGISSASLLNHHVLAKPLRKLFLSNEGRHTCEVISTAKAVIVKGGGFIHSYGGLTSTYHMYYNLFHILLALKLDRPVIVMPNSFGPFDGFYVSRMTRSILGQCDAVFARESISSRMLGTLLGKKIPTYPDLAFFLEQTDAQHMRDYLVSKGVPLGSMPCVGITVRPYRFPKSDAPLEEYNNYVSVMADFAEWLFRAGFHPVFVAHTLGPSAHEDDRIAINDIVAKIRAGSYSIINDHKLNCMDLKALYGQLDFLVGTRFHSVIFALALGVPSLAIAYGGNKGHGIMGDLGLNEYSLSIEKMSFSNLKEKFCDLINNQQRTKNIMGVYLEKASYQREALKACLNTAIMKRTASQRQYDFL